MIMFAIFYSVLLFIIFSNSLHNIAKTNEKETISYNIKTILQIVYLTAVFIGCLKSDNAPLFLGLSLPLVLIDIIYFIYDRWKNRSENAGELIILTFMTFLQILCFLSWEY